MISSFWQIKLSIAQTMSPNFLIRSKQGTIFLQLIRKLFDENFITDFFFSLINFWDFFTKKNGCSILDGFIIFKWQRQTALTWSVDEEKHTMHPKVKEGIPYQKNSSFKMVNLQSSHEKKQYVIIFIGI